MRAECSFDFSISFCVCGDVECLVTSSEWYTLSGEWYLVSVGSGACVTM